MLSQISKIITGIFALICLGGISYIYLNKEIDQRAPAQLVVVDNTPAIAPIVKVPISTTSKSAIVPKKVVTKEPTPIKTIESVSPKVPATLNTVVAPGPLRAESSATSVPSTTSTLSIYGVIKYTNTAREQNGGLLALAENTTLDRDAQMKLSDMFAKQYFEHVSPTGVGPAELAKAVGYSYVIVGENLALGDFAGDFGVVTAWMNSPGHRANILNTHYQEIGVAVGKGMYEGRETWIAVQSFGMPLSSCPAIDSNLKLQIDANNLTIANLRMQLDSKKAQIDATSTNDPNYNVYVNEFNVIVPEYNSLVENNRANVSKYNSGIQAFNACIGAVSVTTTAH